MIEKHYGRYIKSDSQEQLERIFGPKPKPLPKPYAMGLMMKGTKLLKTKVEVIGRGEWI